VSGEHIDWRERDGTTTLADLYDGDYHLITAEQGNLADCPYYRDGGLCGGGASCSTRMEPMCVTEEPEHGWRPLREDVLIPHPLPGVQYADGVYHGVDASGRWV